uniref:Sulfotransferase n=1 Tax=Varanus komodoensis TaxID=61221 RepID=A0A8D2J8Y3_VARKO
MSRGEEAQGSALRLDVTETFAGLALPGHLHTQESLQLARAFPFRGTDALLVTYPKSGTTWLQEILTLIYSKGDAEPVKTLPNWVRTPWLEHTYFKSLPKQEQDSRIFTTHLPHRVLAATLRKTKPKVIYLARNPKDVAVSYYHFSRMANFLPDPGSFDEFLLRFLDGAVHFGSWFEHVKGWLSCQDELTVLYLTYEELYQLEASVGRLSAFLDRPLQPGQVDAIQRHCSFASMRESPMVNGALVPREILDPSKTFFRSGIVGDWRNHFSPQQNELFSRKYQQEVGDLCRHFRWALD